MAVHFGAPTPLGASAPSSGDYRVPLPSIPPLPGGGRGVHFGPVLVSGEHQRVSIPSVPPLPPGSRVSLTSPTGEHLPVVIGESPQRGTPFLHSPHRGTPFIDENATGKVPVQSSVSLGSAPPRGRPGWLSVVVLVVAALLVGWLGWLLAGTTVDR